MVHTCSRLIHEPQAVESCNLCSINHWSPFRVSEIAGNLGNTRNFCFYFAFFQKCSSTLDTLAVEAYFVQIGDNSLKRRKIFSQKASSHCPWFSWLLLEGSAQGKQHPDTSLPIFGRAWVVANQELTGKLFPPVGLLLWALWNHSASFPPIGHAFWHHPDAILKFNIFLIRGCATQRNLPNCTKYNEWVHQRRACIAKCSVKRS